MALIFLATRMVARSVQESTLLQFERVERGCLVRWLRLCEDLPWCTRWLCGPRRIHETCLRALCSEGNSYPNDTCQRLKVLRSVPLVFSSILLSPHWSRILQKTQKICHYVSQVSLLEYASDVHQSLNLLLVAVLNNTNGSASSLY